MPFKYQKSIHGLQLIVVKILEKLLKKFRIEREKKNKCYIFIIYLPRSSRAYDNKKKCPVSVCVCVCEDIVLIFKFVSSVWVNFKVKRITSKTQYRSYGAYKFYNIIHVWFVHICVYYVRRFCRM